MLNSFTLLDYMANVNQKCLGRAHNTTPFHFVGLCSCQTQVIRKGSKLSKIRKRNPEGVSVEYFDNWTRISNPKFDIQRTLMRC